MSFKTNPVTYLSRRLSKTKNPEEDGDNDPKSSTKRVRVTSKIFSKSPNILRRNRSKTPTPDPDTTRDEDSITQKSIEAPPSPTPLKVKPANLVIPNVSPHISPSIPSPNRKIPLPETTLPSRSEFVSYSTRIVQAPLAKPDFDLTDVSDSSIAQTIGEPDQELSAFASEISLDNIYHIKETENFALNSENVVINSEYVAINSENTAINSENTALNSEADEITETIDEQPVKYSSDEDSELPEDIENVDYTAEPWEDPIEPDIMSYELQYPSELNRQDSILTDTEVDLVQVESEPEEFVSYFDKEHSYEEQTNEATEVLKEQAALMSEPMVVVTPADGSNPEVINFDECHQVKQSQVDATTPTAMPDAVISYTNDCEDAQMNGDDMEPYDYEGAMNQHSNVPGTEEPELEEQPHDPDEPHDPDQPQFDVQLDPENDPFDCVEVAVLNDSPMVNDENAQFFSETKAPWEDEVTPAKLKSSEPALVSISDNEQGNEELAGTVPSRPPPRKPPPPSAHPGAKPLPGRPPPPAPPKSPKKHKVLGMDLGPLPSDPDPTFGFKSHFDKKRILPNPKKGIQNIIRGEKKKERLKRKEKEELERIISKKDKNSNATEPPKQESDSQWLQFQELTARITATVEDSVSRITTLSTNLGTGESLKDNSQVVEGDSDIENQDQVQEESGWASFDTNKKTEPTEDPNKFEAFKTSFDPPVEKKENDWADFSAPSAVFPDIATTDENWAANFKEETTKTLKKGPFEDNWVEPSTNPKATDSFSVSFPKENTVKSQSDQPESKLKQLSGSASANESSSVEEDEEESEEKDDEEEEESESQEYTESDEEEVIHKETPEAAVNQSDWCAFGTDKADNNPGASDNWAVFSNSSSNAKVAPSTESDNPFLAALNRGVQGAPTPSVKSESIPDDPFFTSNADPFASSGAFKADFKDPELVARFGEDFLAES